MIDYRRLEDSYEDIKGATIDTLERNKDKYKLPMEQAISYFINEMEGIFEENAFERIVTLIPIGIFMMENNYCDYRLKSNINESISIIESNKNNDLYFLKKDKEEILQDINIVKNFLVKI